MNAFPRVVIASDGSLVCRICNTPFEEFIENPLYQITALRCETCGTWQSIAIETEPEDETL
jgi:translation initiation factor 2 beta subunit (eIF-2beta)/eIF-5